MRKKNQLTLLLCYDVLCFYRFVKTIAEELLWQKAQKLSRLFGITVSEMYTLLHFETDKTDSATKDKTIAV